MLTRQKVLLALLDQVKFPLSPTVFVKMVFLLRQETGLKEDHTFYDFVPYKYGPFSFSLYRELTGMRNHGYVMPGEEYVTLSPATRELTDRTIADLPTTTRRAVASVVRDYGNKSQRDLLRQVYTRYPWYATNSELDEFLPANIPDHPATEIAVYTVGYEGKSVDSFFDGLLRAGIRTILDVRANPVSRKYGFAKKSLQEIANKLGLDYFHLPQLGIPGEQRTALTSRAAYDELLDRYEREMLPQQPGAFSRLLGLLGKTASALLCMEKDVTCCHRGRLAKAVSAHTNLAVVHL